MKAVRFITFLLVVLSDNLSAQDSCVNKSNPVNIPLPVETALAAKTDCLFEKPLVIGASLSSGYKATDPATLIATRIGHGDRVKNLAIPYKQSGEVLSKVKKKDFKTASSIVALDLFYWDSKKKSCAETENAIRHFFDLMRKIRTPLVIGTIIGTDDCTRKLNESIHSKCTSGKSCILFDLNSFWLKLASGTPVTVQGKTVEPRVLMADNLHPNLLGSNYLADQILETIAKSPVDPCH